MTDELGDARPGQAEKFMVAQAIQILQGVGYAVVTPGRLRNMDHTVEIRPEDVPAEGPARDQFYRDTMLTAAMGLVEAMVEAGVFQAGPLPAEDGKPPRWLIRCTVLGPTPAQVAAVTPKPKVRRLPLNPKRMRKGKGEPSATVTPIKAPKRNR